MQMTSVFELSHPFPSHLKLGHFFFSLWDALKSGFFFFFWKTSQAEQHTFSWPGVSSSPGQLSLVTVNPLLQQNIIFKTY